MNTENLVSPDDTAHFLGIKPQTLAIWRVRGFGPHFVKCGRLVKYRQDAIEKFIAERERSSTSNVK